MELYILKSTICLALLFVFYKMLLENSSKHHFKRLYLLGSIATAFLIPLITFTTYVEPSQIVPIYTSGTAQIVLTGTEEAINYLPIVLWSLYGLGVLFFSVKFFRNIYFLIRKIRRNNKIKERSFIYPLLSETVIPHTFFSYIFLNKKEFETGNIPAEVMLHEETHASQIHSLDIILIEILKIVFWFNPLLYFLKRSIKLNHEFLADQAVLKNGIETSAYQKLLLAFSTPDGQNDILTPSLAHSINYSSMKKRFSIMKTNTSRTAILFRSFLILPLLSFLIYGFSTTETIERHSDSGYIFTNDTIQHIQIKIDINSKIVLNGKSVNLSNLKDELNKLNTNLSAEQKQKYLAANLEVENENLRDLAEEVGNILYTCNIRNWSVTNLKGERDADLKHTPQNNSNAGKSLEEAEKLYQEDLKQNEKYLRGIQNARKDENNPWSVQVGEPVERDKISGEIIQQKATKAEVKEYNKLAKKYNSMSADKRIIENKDLERLVSIYKKMTDEQKAKAEPFPKFAANSASNKTNFYFNQNINTNIPTPTTPSFFTNEKDVKYDASTVFMYEDMVIPVNKAVDILFKGENEIYTLSNVEDGKNVVRISKSPLKNGNKFVPSQPLTPSFSNKDEATMNISESDKIKFHFNTPKNNDNLSYYYEDKLIPFSKAHKLLSENSALRVYITQEENGQSIARLSETPILGKKQLEAAKEMKGKEN